MDVWAGERPGSGRTPSRAAPNATPEAARAGVPARAGCQLLRPGVLVLWAPELPLVRWALALLLELALAFWVLAV